MKQIIIEDRLNQESITIGTDVERINLMSFGEMDIVHCESHKGSKPAMALVLKVDDELIPYIYDSCEFQIQPICFELYMPETTCVFVLMARWAHCRDVIFCAAFNSICKNLLEEAHIFSEQDTLNLLVCSQNQYFLHTLSVKKFQSRARDIVNQIHQRTNGHWPDKDGMNCAQFLLNNTSKNIVWLKAEREGAYLPIETVTFVA